MNCKRMIFVQTVGGLVPCGRCHHCRINRRNKKTARLALEGITHEDVLFVTLTYSDEFLPRDIYCPVTGEVLFSHVLGCLDKRAVQLFLKRLRKKLPPKSLRYFYCGEYGERKGRPHYHFILWGLPYSRRNLIFESWSDPHTGRLMCDPDYLDIQVPRSSHEVSQYCNSYILKGQTNVKNQTYLQGRPPEFSGSSKGIGLDSVDLIISGLQSISGSDFIRRESDIPRSFTLGGKSYPIDRYLKQKIIQRLGIEDLVKETGQKKYQEEMQALRARTRSNKKFHTQIARHLFMSEADAEKDMHQLMAEQHSLENRAKLEASEKRFNLSTSRKGEF